jgi:hypothetical protein
MRVVRMVNYRNWAIFGAFVGLIEGILLFLLLTFGGAAIAAMAGSSVPGGFLLGGFVGLVVIAVFIFLEAVSYLIYGWVSTKTSKYVAGKNPVWRITIPIWTVSGIVLLLESFFMNLNAMAVLLGFVLTPVLTWVYLWLFKKARLGKYTPN